MVIKYAAQIIKLDSAVVIGTSVYQKEQRQQEYGDQPGKRKFSYQVLS